MKFKATFTPSRSLEELKDQLPTRLRNLQRAIGQDLAAQTADVVKAKIPSGKWWQKLYRDAITYREHADGNEWAVAGLAKTMIGDVDAETSEIRFAGLTPDGAALRPYNPWVLDQIPVIAGGYKDSVVVRSAGESVVTGHRSRLVRIVPIAIQTLEDSGFSIEDGGKLQLNGATYVDIAFLAWAMEVGADGHERIPHWGPAANKLRTNAEKWARSAPTVRKADAALLGEEIPAVNLMSASEAEELRRIRDATWA